MVQPYEIVLYPFVTEKTMSHLETQNKLEFVVKRSATKLDIKEAVESLFDVKVDKVNTMILKDGKHAVVKLTKDFSAEDVGMRIGIF